MAKPQFVNEEVHADTTTALTLERAKKLLSDKNARIGRDQYELFGIYPEGNIGKFAYVLANRAKNDGSGFRARPTIFWADGDMLRPCTKTIHSDKFLRVRARLAKDLGK